MRRIPSLKEVEARIKAAHDHPDFEKAYEEFMKATTSSAGYKKE